MAQSNRQVRMFAAEDYLAVYDSYVNANFQAFDFQTIRDSMITYIQAQYPENFNDWIESSDFVALLDVVAQFGHNLAFRNDLNSRNNFLSTAERQESVFKLAEFLGYVPRRNTPASGELKITSIKTTEQVLGSSGKTLAGKELKFNNSTTNAGFDDFIAVMNSVFSVSNQFGNPKKVSTISGITNYFYNLNNTENQIVFEFTGNVTGSSKPFNVIGLDYNLSSGKIIESYPDPKKAFSIVYKNDGRGLSSKNTGFFVGFKQGTLSFKDFSITTPISNMTLDVNVDNINQGDVWVQTIDENGNVLKNWNQVDSINGFNEIYNAEQRLQRNIFAVKSRENNQISILFPDESFGALPKGLIRVWYRVGVDQSYVLRSDDIGNKNINIKYTGIDGNIYTATLSVALQKTINNASAKESLDEIKQNAPRAFSAQDRMITGDDYNNFLITQSTQIAKVKSVNRTHSGHSRFINPVDPTGAYSNLKLYSNDGVIDVIETVNQDNTNNISSQLIFDRYIKTALENTELANLYYHKFYASFEAAETQEVYQYIPVENTSGYFVNSLSNVSSNISDGFMSYVKVGSLVKLTDTETGKDDWARVISVSNSGYGINSTGGTPSGLDYRGFGAIILDKEIKTTRRLTMVYPPFPRQFTFAEREEILNLLEQRNKFVIYYDYNTLAFKTEVKDISNTELFPPVFSNESGSWLIYCEPTTDQGYDVSTRVVKFQLSSEQIQFSNITNEYKLDYHTNKKKRDSINVLINSLSYGNFFIYGYSYDANGVFESNKVNLVFEDANNDGRPDNPEVYFSILNNQPLGEKIRFEWTHVPDNNQALDPSFSNIIDAYILTKSYDNEFRNWLIKNDNSLLNIPLAPTSDELTQQFVTTNKKAMSDTIIYRPVKYKVLFGNKATAEVRGSFKVVRAVGSTMTDNEIKSTIIESIYDFFEIENWDFGETFYYTELAAYIHKKLTGQISSVVVVPESTNSVFGKLFQIIPMSDELFIPDVSLSDIDIINSITNENLRAG